MRNGDLAVYHRVPGRDFNWLFKVVGFNLCSDHIVLAGPLPDDFRRVYYLDSIKRVVVSFAGVVRCES